MKELSRQTRVRYLMTLLILITIPCYLLGFILLKLDRGPQPNKPTRTPTVTLTSIPTITLTPYLTRTASITPTVTQTLMPTLTYTATATMTVTPSPTATSLPTATPALIPTDGNYPTDVPDLTSQAPTPNPNP